MPEEPTKKSEKGDAASAPAKKKKSKKLLFIALGVILLAGGGGAAVMMRKPHDKPKGEATKPVEEELAGDAKTEGEHGKAEGGAEVHGEKGAAGETEKPSMIYKFDDQFVVNLIDPKGRQFLQAKLQLEASSPKALKQIQENVAPLRDAIIMLLSSKSREDIETGPGKDRFKRELLARIDGILEPKSVKNVYITDMLVMQQ